MNNTIKIKDTFMAEAATEDRPASQIVRNYIEQRQQGREHDDYLRGKGSVMDDVRAALLSVVEADGGCDRYYSEDDDIGFRACCDAISYKPHEEDCYVMQARRALETLGPVE